MHMYYVAHILAINVFSHLMCMTGIVPVISTLAGRVLNRFSKDIGFLDDLLPHTFLEYLFVSIQCSKHVLVVVYYNVTALSTHAMPQFCLHSANFCTLCSCY